MSNIELLAQVGQLSRDEKFQMVQFLMTELAKEEELKPLDNSAAYRLWSPYDPADAARKLMSLLEIDNLAKCGMTKVVKNLN